MTTVVDSHYGYVAPLASACTYVLATACYGTHVCPASICLVAIHCLHPAPGRFSTCTMRGLSLACVGSEPINAPPLADCPQAHQSNTLRPGSRYSAYQLAAEKYDAISDAVENELSLAAKDFQRTVSFTSTNLRIITNLSGTNVLRYKSSTCVSQNVLQ
nr:unnamed protein product [Spirometra erinaceieuropaei]